MFTLQGCEIYWPESTMTGRQSHRGTCYCIFLFYYSCRHTAPRLSGSVVNHWPQPGVLSLPAPSQPAGEHPSAGGTCGLKHNTQVTAGSCTASDGSKVNFDVFFFVFFFCELVQLQESHRNCCVVTFNEVSVSNGHYVPKQLL